jgi:hypothetical protein
MPAGGEPSSEIRELKLHEEAALIINFAINAQDVQKERLNWRIRACYRLRRKYQHMYRTAAWSILFFHVFSRPLWTLRPGIASDWNDSNIYPSYQLPYMPVLASHLLIGLATLILWVSVLLEFGYLRQSRHRYFSLFFAVVLTLISLDIIMALVYYSAGEVPSFSASPLFSLPILLVERRWDNHTLSLLRLLPRMAMLLFMIATTVCLFSALALLILPHSSEEIAEVFGTYGDTVWNMLMMLNASNWPTPFMPAYDSNRAYAIFFFAFIMVGDWCVLNMVLGFICMYFNAEQSFVANSEKEIFDRLHLRAFKLLDEENNGSLSYSQVDAVLKELYDFYERAMRLPSENERYELILLLDPQNDGFITYENFLCISDRCLSKALHSLRGKKEKVSRFMHASVDHGYLAETYISDGTRLSVDQSLMQLAEKQDSVSAVVRQESKRNFSDNYIGAEGIQQRQQLQTVMDASVYAKLDARIVDRLRQQSTSVVAPTFPSLAASIEIDLPESEQESKQEKTPWWISFLLDSITPQRPLFNKSQTILSRQKNVVSSWAYALMFVDSFYFDITMDTIVDIIAIICLSGIDCTGPYIALTVFVCFEMVCKFYVKGWYRYIRSKRNSIDGLMAIIYTILIVAQSIATKLGHPKRFCENYGAHILLLLRVFLWPRNILALKSYARFRQNHRLAFQYAFKSLDQLLFLCVVMAVYLYGFAAFVQQIYGGVITKTGDKGEAITASPYGQNEYWPFNYNDMPSGLVTTFVLLHVSNMHVITQGYVAGKNDNDWPEALFACSYIFGVLFLLNVLVAFIINQFVKYLDGLRRQRYRARRNAALKQPTKVEDITAVSNPLRSEEKDESPRQAQGAEEEIDDKDVGGEDVSSNQSVISEDDAIVRDSMSNPQHLHSNIAEEITGKGKGEISPNPSLLAALTHLSEKQEAMELGVSLPDETILMASNSIKKILEKKSKNAPPKVTEGTLQEDISETEEVETEHGIPIMKVAASLQPPEPTTKWDAVPLPSQERSSFIQSTKPILDILSLHEHVTNQDDERPILVTLSIHQLEEFIQLEKLQNSNLENNIPANEVSSEDSPFGQDEAAKPEADMTWWEYYCLGHKLIKSPLEEAKILLHFAQEGAEKYFIPNDVGYVCCVMRRRFSWGFQIASIVYALLRFFSRPFWSYAQYAESDWNNPSVYPRSGIPLMSTRAEAAVKIPLLLVILCGLVLEIGYKEDLFSPTFSWFKLSKSRWMRFILALYTLVTVLLLAGALGSADFEYNNAKQQIVCGTSVGALMYVLWFQKMSLLKLRVFLHILPRLSVFIAIFVIIIMIFASFGPMLMDDRTYANTVSGHHDDDTYFNSFTNSVWSIFAAIAASSYPQQFIPIYQAYRDTALYFLAFISVGAFAMLNLILVLVFVEFQRSSKLLVRQTRVTRMELLTKVFHLLARVPSANHPLAHSTVESRPYLPRHTVMILLRALRSNYADFERFGLSTGFGQSLLVDIIDVDGDGRIGLDEFMYLIDISRVKLHVEKFSLEYLHHMELMFDKQVSQEISSPSSPTQDQHHVHASPAASAHPASAQIPIPIPSAGSHRVSMFTFHDEETAFPSGLHAVVGSSGGGTGATVAMVASSPVNISMTPSTVNTANRPTMVINDEDRASLFDILLHHNPPTPHAFHPPMSPIQSPHLSINSPGSHSNPLKSASDVNNNSLQQFTYPRIPDSALKQIRIELAAHRSMFELLFDIIFDLLIIICTILSLSLSAHRLYEYATSEVALLFLMSLLRLGQVGFNIYLYGVKKAFHSFRNVSDFALGFLLFVLMLGDVATQQGHGVSGWIITARCVNMLQLALTLRITRSLFSALYRAKLQHLSGEMTVMDPRFVQLLQELRLLRYYQLLLLRFGRLFRRSLGRLKTLGIIFLCTGYGFAVLGMLCFGGIISYTRQDPDFLASTYVLNDFYAWNFNDFASAVLLLGCCLHVSDFDVIAAGFTSTTNSNAAKLYFLSWYIIGVLLLLNVIKAFFLSEFVIVFSATDSLSPTAAPSNKDHHKDDHDAFDIE